MSPWSWRVAPTLPAAESLWCFPHNHATSSRSLLFERASCQPVHNAYQIWSISIQWIQCVCTGVCVSVCVGVCALCTASLGALHVQSKGWSRGRVSVVLLSWTCVLQKETQSTSPTVQYPFFGKMHCCPESLALSSNRIYSKPRMVLYKSVFALIGKLVRSRPSSLVISRFCLSTCSGRKIEDLWGP